MKNFKLIAMVLPLLFSCTPDVPLTTESQETYMKVAVAEPSNPLNPYDNYGAIRNRILDAALKQLPEGHSEAQLIKIVQGIADADSDFQSLKTLSYRGLSVASLQGYLQESPATTQAVAGLPLSNDAKVNLASFIDGLLYLRQEDYEVIRDHVMAFEHQVVNTASYSDGDRKLLLTVGAMERYSAYYRKKPKDKDWDLLIGNIVAGAEGANYDTATAILYSVSIEAALHTTF
jgi:hypothetical protein